jgi:hypothetical protein
VIAKTETYDIYLKVKPSHIFNSSSLGFVAGNDKSSLETNFFDEVILAPSSYTIDIIVCMEKNVLLEDQMKNV